MDETVLEENNENLIIEELMAVLVGQSRHEAVAAAVAGYRTCHMRRRPRAACCGLG